MAARQHPAIAPRSGCRRAAPIGLGWLGTLKPTCNKLFSWLFPTRGQDPPVVKPADSTLSSPHQVRSVINLKTAKALGLTIPPVLARADQVIE
jgi:hypothetical protein